MRDSRRLAVVFVLMCLMFGGIAPARGELRSVGKEVSILGGPGCNENGLDVASLPAAVAEGGFVAVWRGTPEAVPVGVNKAALYARVFDGAGQPLGAARRFAFGTTNDHPVVAAGDDGSILVAWHDAEINGAVAQIFRVTFGVLTMQVSPIALPFSSANSGIDAVATPTGFAVLVTEGNAARLSRLTAVGLVTSTEVVRPPDFSLPIWSLANPRLALHGTSGLAAVWTAEEGRHRRIEGRILGGVPSYFFIVRSSQEPDAGMPEDPDVASAGNGNVLIAWREVTTGNLDVLYDRAFDSAGRALGGLHGLNGENDVLSAPALESVGAYIYLAWVRPSSSSEVALEIAVRPLSATGEPLEPVTEVPSLHVGSASRPVLAAREGSRLILAWNDAAEITLDPCGTAGLFAQRFDNTDIVLALQQGRFRVSVRWTDHQGHSGDGQAVPLTDDSGYFWFFGPDNIELMVKILDGRAVNSRFWVFYASLSDVAFDVTVTDTGTGLFKTYENPAGRLASLADTQTFFSSSPSGGATVRSSSPVLHSEAVDAPAGPCTDPSLPVGIRPGLCLGDRFEVEVSWRTPDGATGAGEGVELTADSGYLWFFGANNIEIVAKVLDGRAVNGHFWFFYGALSNVEYDIVVRDIVTGAERTYHNPAGRLASVADTTAF